MATRNDQFLEFLSEMAELFPHFKVIASNPKQSNPTGLSINEVIADQSDNEICLVGSVSKDATAISLNLAAFQSNLREQLEQHPDYSLMVSEWVQIDEEHTGRVDMPLQNVEVDEDAEEFRLLF